MTFTASQVVFGPMPSVYAMTRDLPIGDIEYTVVKDPFSDDKPDQVLVSWETPTGKYHCLIDRHKLRTEL